MLATLEELLLSLRVQSAAGQEQRRVVGVQQSDGDKLAGLNQLIGSPEDQFTEHRIQALGWNRPAPEPDDAEDRAERVGDQGTL